MATGKSKTKKEERIGGDPYKKRKCAKQIAENHHYIFHRRLRLDLAFRRIGANQLFRAIQRDVLF
ncbi:MAG: hypothetical protein VB071_08460, partial [Lawsonibacter sp.]|nr:hypothetical protein [Lawsonibacter sp.]